MILFTCKLARKYVILRAFYFNRGKSLIYLERGNSFSRINVGIYDQYFSTKQVAKTLKNDTI